jgi:hypothetical protein
MSPGRWFRYAPLLGVLFVILVVAGFLVIGDTPGSDALPPEIKDKYDDQAKHLIGLYLVTLGAVALLFFASHLRGALRLLDPFGRMANAAFAGAVTTAVGLMVAAGIHGAITDAVDQKEVSGPALQALNVLDNWSFVPLGAGMAVLLLATGIAIVRGARLIPAWFGWLGVIIGIVGISPLGFFGALAGVLWLLALSVMLYIGWETLHRDSAAPGVPPAGRMPA